jgi:hypothetical protein
MDLDTTRAGLRKMNRADLNELLFRGSETHVALCNIASIEIDPHVDEAAARARIDKLTLDDVVNALAPLAHLGQILHEHHAEHGASHG